MKKRTLSFLLALVMCLSLLPMTALAAYTPDPAKFDAPIIADLAISEKVTGGATLTFTLKNPENIKAALAYYDENSSDGAFWGIEGEISIDGGEWTSSGITSDSQNLDEGTYETGLFQELRINSQVKFRLYYTGWDVNGYYSGWYGDEMGKYSNVLTLNEKVNIIASETFLPEIEKADAWGLIPDCLVGQDLTKRITRGEFAAVCVKLYENLSGEAAVAAPADTFTDTTDPEILKAFQVGITNGKYDGGKRFAPDEGLNRQECATMLTRVYKKVSLPGWSLAEDANFQLQFTQPALFKDDADIGGFARNSVYFMAANGVINGYTDGTFHPRNTTAAQEAAGYANATRQHALVFSTRIVEKLG